MGSVFYLRLEAYAGITVEDAAKEMCRLRDLLSIDIWMNFNGVTLRAYLKSTPKDIIKNYCRNEPKEP